MSHAADDRHLKRFRHESDTSLVTIVLQQNDRTEMLSPCELFQLLKSNITPKLKKWSGKCLLFRNEVETTELYVYDLVQQKTLPIDFSFPVRIIDITLLRNGTFIADTSTDDFDNPQLRGQNFIRFDIVSGTCSLLHELPEIMLSKIIELDNGDIMIASSSFYTGIANYDPNIFYLRDWKLIHSARISPFVHITQISRSRFASVNRSGTLRIWDKNLTHCDEIETENDGYNTLVEIKPGTIYCGGFKGYVVIDITRMQIIKTGDTHAFAFFKVSTGKHILVDNKMKQLLVFDQDDNQMVQIDQNTRVSGWKSINKEVYPGVVGFQSFQFEIVLYNVETNCLEKYRQPEFSFLGGFIFE
jgi:hypothetical protein